MTAEWQPTASLEVLARRAILLERIRAFFSERGVTEVNTPLLTACGVSDVHIDSIATADPHGWLRTSPEYFHKRLLAAGFGDLYELGPVFRRGEIGRQHQPEFTLLEWYRVGWGWRQLAAETIELIRLALDDPRRRALYISWQDCMGERLGIDPLSCSVGELAALADDAPAGLDRDALLDWLFATRVQPLFPEDRITVVFDYPASQAALARIDPGNPSLANRFEVFVGPLELANGYHELGDAREQRERFERDNARREEMGRERMPVDERLLAALEAGLPDCSGVALGFDRLLMAALGAESISEMLAFARRSPG